VLETVDIQHTNERCHLLDDLLGCEEAVHRLHQPVEK
jgi:hypothetical protein